MRIEEDSPERLLGELRRLLASSQLPVQQRVAAEVGVAQSLVSRARNGKLRRVTRKVRQLHEYARSRVGAEELAAAVAGAMDAEAETAADGSLPAQEASAAGPADGYSREALKGVKAYLKEGYDPRLILDQLAVLRRAQRLRRPGRSPRVAAGDQFPEA